LKLYTISEANVAREKSFLKCVVRGGSLPVVSPKRTNMEFVNIFRVLSTLRNF